MLPTILTEAPLRIAAAIIANSNPAVKKKLNNWRSSQTRSVKKNPK